MKKVIFLIIPILSVAFSQCGNVPVNQSDDPRIYASFDDFEALLHREDGQLYVVNFWATWCKPCIKELPYFEAINEKYKDKGVSVLLVSLDGGKQIEKNLIPFLKENKLKSKVVVLDDTDFNSWIDKVSPEWSGAIPASLFYNNKEREFREQSFEYEELEALVHQMMGEK